MRKRFVLLIGILLTLTVALPVFAGGDKEKAAETDETSAAAAKAGPYEIAFLLKSQAQDFWNHIRIGGMNYAKENPDKVKATLYAAKNDAAVEEALGILENIIVTQPDAIVMASVNPETMAPLIDRASAQGIVVVTINDSVKQWTDAYDAEFVSDNYGGGELAGEFLVDLMKENGKPLEGKVAIHSALAGLPDLVKRCQGFQDKVLGLAPKMEFLDWRYSDVDPMKQVSLAQDVISAEGDELACIYIDAGPTLPAAIRVFYEQNIYDDIYLIGWDSSPEAIDGLENGYLKGLVLQDPFGMGYMGMEAAVKILDGKTVQKDNTVPTVIFTKKDIGTREAAEFLDPTLKEIK
jgi:ribose transport system substrate-binding protein